MIDLLFDQYQRYKNVVDAINSLRKPGEVFRILEVGANEHRNLEKFLPDDSIKYLDIELPEELLNHPDYVLGDATQMEFSDADFDVVVALDVFEHIPPGKREDFIDELHRVSKAFFVITAPFASPLVSEAERRANAVYKTFFGEDFRWLAEHFENGLPDQSELEEHLVKLGGHYRKLNHGNLQTWESMMEIHFLAAYLPALYHYRAEIDRFYNQHLYEDDYVHDSYRKIYIHSKEREMSDLIERRSVQNRMPERFQALEARKGTFFSLASAQKVQIQKESGMIDKIQFFWDDGNGFNETQSVQIVKDTENAIHKFVWEEPSATFITSLRIDPSDRKGIYKIENLLITDTEGQRIKEISQTGNYVFSFNENFVFTNDDPFFILTFVSPLQIGSVSFDVVSLMNDERALLMQIENKALKVKDLNGKSAGQAENIQRLNEEIKQLQTNREKEIAESLERIRMIEQEKLHAEQELTEAQHNLQVCVEENLRMKQTLEEIYSAKSWRLASLIRKLVGRR
ncbi:class I SAM-dependent methyltransferase [Saccharibacillus deserti]|uniref:class I SAM-dependent methyltransferase n=1 Tax=Saccharibacillus deserti TaxID=1634444 RepID=UPI0015564EA1|nr:class I SAM-dependent methyltransferase [Saccharibacillus deserti]